jgi:surfeit locus 1 family protein
VPEPSPRSAGATDTAPGRPLADPPADRSGEIVASPAPVLPGKPPADWSFVVTPRWILSHLFVAACCAAMIWAGFWQLSRLQGRRQINRMIEAREVSPAVPLQTLVSATESQKIANHKDFRQVTVTGRYDSANEILIRNEQDDQFDPGWWLVTPMILPDGTAVAINRGFVPLTLGENAAPGVAENGPLPQYAPPKGTVTVTGLVYATENRTGGSYDPATGRLHTLSRVDLVRYQRQLPYRIFPVYVSLATSKPPQHGTYPEPISPPALGDGPHLNYAGQWFIFTLITIIVYPLLLRRVARNRTIVEEDDTAGEEGDGGDGDGDGDGGGDAPRPEPADAAGGLPV